MKDIVVTPIAFEQYNQWLTEPTKEEILEGIKQAVKEVNLIKEGKLNARDAREILTEL